MKKHFRSLRIESYDDKGVVTGYLNRFGEPDSYGTVFEASAFQSAIDKGVDKLRVLFNHDWNTPIGSVAGIRFDNVGTLVDLALPVDIPSVNDIYQKVRAGILDGISFGFMEKDSGLRYSGGVGVYTDIDMFEVSIVTFPAGENSRVTSVRGDDNPLGAWMNEREFETIGDAAQSTNLTVAVLRDLEEGNYSRHFAELAGHPSLLAHAKAQRSEAFSEFAEYLKDGATEAELQKVRAIITPEINYDKILTAIKG